MTYIVSSGALNSTHSLEKSVIFNDFRAISAREGGNTVCWKAMARTRTDDDSVTYCFLWKHPMAIGRGLEFGVFDQTPPKTVSGLPFRASQMHQAPIFRPFDVRLAVSDVLRSTPTTPSVAVCFIVMGHYRACVLARALIRVLTCARSAETSFVICRCECDCIFLSCVLYMCTDVTRARQV